MTTRRKNETEQALEALAEAVVAIQVQQETILELLEGLNRRIDDLQKRLRNQESRERRN